MALDTPGGKSAPHRVAVAKVKLRNLLNGDSVIAQLNPTRLRTRIAPEWNRLPVIGLDHEVLQYSRTRSLEIPLSFYFSAFEQARQKRDAVAENRTERDGPKVAATGKERAIRFHNFLSSLCFPTRAGRRPPDVEVVWPGILNFVGVVADLSFDFIKFDHTLAPLVYTADVTFLEVRLARRFSEEVRTSGLEVPDPEVLPRSTFGESEPDLGFF
jgi:hypothetical protein